MAEEELVKMLNQALKLEHSIKHVIQDEQGHISELKLLLGR